MKAAIISFPGSYDLENTKRVFADVLGINTTEVLCDFDNLDLISPYDLLILPGGAAYGDAVRPGRLARTAKIAMPLRKYAEGNGLLLGIGNGFQILCELGILPGILLKNKNCAYINRKLLFSAANSESVFTKGLPAETAFNLPVSCYYGRYYADRRVLLEIEEKGQIAFHYTTRFGDPDAENLEHGSLSGIAGVLSRKKNALGVIFHPERAAEPALGQTDGLTLLKSFVGSGN